MSRLRHAQEIASGLVSGMFADDETWELVSFLTKDDCEGMLGNEPNTNSQRSKGGRMAKVQAQVVGGQIKQLEADTVGEVKEALNAQTYTATVNGEPANSDTQLEDYEFVSLAPAVKGA